ncbi:MAG: DUF2071 domain-containing protein [Verrucomicrobiota bacterium]
MTLTMQGRISACVLLAYRTPKRAVEQLVPQGLELVTRGQWAFWNVVASRIEAMRPNGLPAWCGLSYTHVAYRLYVRATNTSTPIEGLFFVRSDADNALISTTGNWLSDFRFHHSQIEFRATNEAVNLKVRNPEASAELHATFSTSETASLITSPCFSSPTEAAQFLKYRPLGLSPNPKALRLAEVFRNETEWRETPLTVCTGCFPFLEQFGPHQLELATQVAPIDYRWRLGKRIALST